MMRDTSMPLARGKPRQSTHETLAAVRAVRRIAQALAANEPIYEEDVETANRILQHSVSWEGLLRTPCGAQDGDPCDAP